MWNTFGTFLVEIEKDYTTGRCNSSMYDKDGVEQVSYRWTFKDGKFACGVYSSDRLLSAHGWVK